MGSSFSICPKELTRVLAIALPEPPNRPMDQSQVYPTISVVVPSYNHAPFLRQALDSVLLQDYPRLELIVVDGGSTDGSVEILKSYSDRLTRWVSEPDRGQTDAINRGIAMAGGEIVAWLNSDDLYLAGCLESAARALQRNPGAGMVYGDGVMVDSTGTVLDHHRYRSLGALDLLCFDVILQPATFMRRQALDAVGGLDDSYNLIMDHDLWVRLAARFPIEHVAEEWAVERTHPEAKTVALASYFVHEAERLVQRAQTDPVLHSLVGRHTRRIEASLDAFAARRLIDAGEYRQATRRFARAARRDPRVPVRYWYKWVQASLSALGLGPLFLGYRRMRRRVQHGGSRVDLGRRGAQIRSVESLPPPEPTHVG
jgi:glycosyltransferase involved in cell wall biosynthesis